MSTHMPDPDCYACTPGYTLCPLHAAAPELLNELSRCLALLTSEAATARIQGYEITDLRTWGHRVQQAIDTARAAIRAATRKE